jgi:hypothetical protein
LAGAPPCAPALLPRLRQAGLDPEVSTLDDLPWAFESETFYALDEAFRLRTDDIELGRFLEDAFAGLTDQHREAPFEVPTYSLFVPSGSQGMLCLDNADLYWHTKLAFLVDRLLVEVNQRAIREEPHRVKIHAGVVDRDGIGVMLPAPSNAGKSTMTASLVLRGYRYLSDEMAAIRINDGKIDAFAKPLALEPGSWPLLGALAPDRDATERFQERQWLVGPRRFPGGIVRETTAKTIVFLKYTPDVATRMRPISAADAVARLAACGFKATSTLAFERLRELASDAATYELQQNDPADACSAIDEVVQGFLT